MPTPESLFNAPIPGQSLTASPDMRGPWENPPAMRTPNQVLDHFLGVVTSDKFIKNFGELLVDDKEFFVDELAAAMLQEGFIKGLYTVDVMMLVAEPLVVMLVWAAAMLGRPASFSTDTGFEDRTGYEELAEMSAEDVIPQEGPEDPTEDMGALEEQRGTQAPQQSPLAQPVQQSPLVGGM